MMHEYTYYSNLHDKIISLFLILPQKSSVITNETHHCLNMKL